MPSHLSVEFKEQRKPKKHPAFTSFLPQSSKKIKLSEPNEASKIENTIEANTDNLDISFENIENETIAVDSSAENIDPAIKDKIENSLKTQVEFEDVNYSKEFWDDLVLKMATKVIELQKIESEKRQKK